MYIYVDTYICLHIYKSDICIYIYLNHFDIHQKLTQYKSTIPQLKKDIILPLEATVGDTHYGSFEFGIQPEQQSGGEAAGKAVRGTRSAGRNRRR